MARMKKTALRFACALLAAVLLMGAACAESRGVLGWLGIGNKAPKAGDKVYIEASDRSDEGLTFVYWRPEMKDLVIDDIYSPNTFYIMPEGNPEIKIEAVYTRLAAPKTAAPVYTATPTPRPIVINTPTPTPYVTPTPQPVQVPEADYYYVSFCEEYVSLRRSPSSDSDKLMNVPLGACVEAISYGHGDFLHVSYNGREGYILWEYLLAESDMPALPGEWMYIVNCQNYVTLRATPFTFGTELDTIPLGEAVEYLGTAANGYAYIRYNNREGFVMDHFVSAW